MGRPLAEEGARKKRAFIRQKALDTGLDLLL